MSWCPTFLLHSDPQGTLLCHTGESLHPPCPLCSFAQPSAPSSSAAHTPSSPSSIVPPLGVLTSLLRGEGAPLAGKAEENTDGGAALQGWILGSCPALLTLLSAWDHCPSLLSECILPHLMINSIHAGSCASIPFVYCFS